MHVAPESNGQTDVQGVDGSDALLIADVGTALVAAIVDRWSDEGTIGHAQRSSSATLELAHHAAAVMLEAVLDPETPWDLPTLQSSLPNV